LILNECFLIKSIRSIPYINMLKGKILNISYKKDGFHIKIERVHKIFLTRQELDNYLKYILKHVKDPYKTKLLKKDLQNYFKKD